MQDAPEAWFQWGEHNVAVQSIRVNPDHITNQYPDTTYHLLIHFVVLDDTLPISDIIVGMESIYLVDQVGTEYYAAAFWPYAMNFNDRNGVFTTAADQPYFDLFYVVPIDVALDSLRMQTDVATPDPLRFYFTDARVEAVIELPEDPSDSD